MIKKYHNHKLQTNPWHREEEPRNNNETPGRQEDKLNKVTSSFFPIKMITKLEWTQSKAQQNIELLQNPTVNGSNNQQRINNNRTTALERTAAQTTGGGGLNAFYWFQIFALDSAFVEAQKMISSHAGFLSIAMCHHRETI